MLLLVLFCAIQLQSFILSFKGTKISQLVNDSTATKISEDLLEVEISGEDRIRDDIEHLDCAQFLESEMIVQSRMSSASFQVRVDPQTCIERRVSFVNSGTQSVNGFHICFNDLKLLKSMRGCTGVAEFISVVRDDTRSHLRSYIYTNTQSLAMTIRSSCVRSLNLRSYPGISEKTGRDKSLRLPQKSVAKGFLMVALGGYLKFVSGQMVQWY